MDATSVNLVLTELRDLRGYMTTQFQAQGERIAKLETSLKVVIGNGQPGLIQNMQTQIDGQADRLKSLEETRTTWHAKVALVASIGATLLTIALALSGHLFAQVK